MSKIKSRRIVPVSAVAMAAFALLVVFEALVIGGALEVKASVVAKLAPWAYEPFLKLVGEHPDSIPRKHAVDGTEETTSSADVLAGFGIDALNDQAALFPSTNAPGQEPAPEMLPTPETEEPSITKTNEPPKEVVPVG